MRAASSIQQLESRSRKLTNLLSCQRWLMQQTCKAVERGVERKKERRKKEREEKASSCLEFEQENEKEKKRLLLNFASVQFSRSCSPKNSSSRLFEIFFSFLSARSLALFSNFIEDELENERKREKTDSKSFPPAPRPVLHGN